MRSVVVVLPASIWAVMPILRILSSGVAGTVNLQTMTGAARPLPRAPVHVPASGSRLRDGPHMREPARICKKRCAPRTFHAAFSPCPAHSLSHSTMTGGLDQGDGAARPHALIRFGLGRRGSDPVPAEPATWLAGPGPGPHRTAAQRGRWADGAPRGSGEQACARAIALPAAAPPERTRPAEAWPDPRLSRRAGAWIGGRHVGRLATFRDTPSERTAR